MWLKLLFPLFSIGLILADATPQHPFPVTEAHLLATELTLAKGEAPYVLLDTGTGTLSLKARGVLLREWKIVKSREWGYPLTSDPLPLLKKSTLISPEREEIKPGQTGTTDTFDIQALELPDMPKKFSLALENGIRIYVTPSPQGISRILLFSTKILRRLFFYPLATINSSLRGSDYRVLEIELESGTEAQSLYWALAEETDFLIFHHDE